MPTHIVEFGKNGKKKILVTKRGDFLTLQKKEDRIF